MAISSSTTPSLPDVADGAPSPLDVGQLARMANALFGAAPGQQALASVPGVQAPVNVAPAGSPLASPAGLAPGIPGTPVPLGQIPGSNLLPSSPTPLASLANRVPGLLPHAQAGNGVPDHALGALPAYEPRIGSAVTGVPPAVAPAGPAAGGAVSPASALSSPFYFSDLPKPGAPAAAGPREPAGLDALARLPFAVPEAPRAAPVPGSAAAGALPSAEPRFYFVDAVTLPDGYVTPPHPSRQGQGTDSGAASGQGAASGAAPTIGSSGRSAFDVHAVRRDFPILAERVNGRPLAWLDNAATTHKSRSVIERISHFYEHENSNIHRAAHELAARATDAYEGARERVRRFLNAPDVNEVIFVRGTTEAINLVAKSWGVQHVGEGDEIIVSHLEHHANIVPWQQLAAAKGAKLRVIPVDDTGQVRLDEYQKLLNSRTRIVAVTQVSNALGTVVPVKQIVEMAHRAGARALVDGAQSVSHMRVDVQDIGADFFVFSGHKVFGPTGIGALWGKREVLEDMPPWQGGGNMIADVTFEKTVYQPLPNTFEAGTGNIADAVGLGAAIDYVGRVGIEAIARYEHELLEYGMRALGSVRGVRLIGTAADKASVMSFVLAGHTTAEVGDALNQEGIAVRTGHHCAQPILRRFGVEATVRPSLAFYNTFEEIDRLVAVVERLSARRP
ncbi:SufS family cysteine desulfurase [Acidovorax sp. GBBC 3334]|uniref:family 2A encapsulin nanocompartment cargo protein cysteine desulfurase n=1 Tax=Acidovorax sp. GBBC 3334 TaxID=2940496 RepID=UPI002303D414|nr:family 2A encapsulin nanocompartment cargo protein cysteine desulfurase [Acidovorax sp. GBBC 3334]MDA8456096.1 SufS family cysteine desulfurase [Acidovorax sp. GBBC 3334]